MTASQKSKVVLNLDQDESQGLAEMAEFYGCTVPELIMAITEQWFEDRYDLQIIKQFKNNESNELKNAISLSQLKKELDYV